MGRLHLSAGTRYRWDGRACVVVQVLRDGQVLVEDQSSGSQAVVTREELTAAWERGAVRFEVQGPGVRAGARRRGQRGTRSRISTCCRRRSGGRRGDGTR